MNERNYKKKFEFQKKIISRQLGQIESLNAQIEKLKLECEKKDNIINSINSFKDELEKDVFEMKKHKKEYIELIKELKRMKDIVNQEVYRGRWKIVRWIIK